MVSNNPSPPSTFRGAPGIKRRQRALRYLVEACDKLGEAHRRRAVAYSFTTLSEEAAISNLRLRLEEWDRERERR